VIELLPALPPEWNRGSVRGLRTRTGVTLDELRWDRAEGMVRAVLTSAREQEVALVCRAARESADRRRSIRLPAGEQVTVTVAVTI
jgi:hypothetical protein